MVELIHRLIDSTNKTFKDDIILIIYFTGEEAGLGRIRYCCYVTALVAKLGENPDLLISTIKVTVKKFSDSKYFSLRCDFI